MGNDCACSCKAHENQKDLADEEQQHKFNDHEMHEKEKFSQQHQEQIPLYNTKNTQSKKEFSYHEDTTEMTVETHQNEKKQNSNNLYAMNTSVVGLDKSTHLLHDKAFSQNSHVELNHLPVQNQGNHPAFDKVESVQEPDFSPEIKQIFQRLPQSEKTFKWDNNDDQGEYFEPQLLKNTKEIYIGQWKNGLRHGRGKQYYPDRQFYEGYFKDDQATGKGRYFDNKGTYFEGSFYDGKPNGYCEMTRADGEKYKGQWKNGVREGKGTETSAKGITYEGDFKQDKMHGNGKYVIENRYTYEGQLVNDDIEGEGKCTWVNGKVYDGSWKSNKMHGKGKFVWKDGKTYQGDFFEDKFDGYGEFSWPNGIKYRGQWQNGEMHGDGELVTERGEVFKGIWKNGQTQDMKIQGTTENQNENFKASTTKA